MNLRELRIAIPAAASREAEERMSKLAIANAEAQSFVRGLAMGLGLDPDAVAQIDTTHDELVLIVEEQYEQPPSEREPESAEVVG